jgi:hypothetical protein
MSSTAAESPPLPVSELSATESTLWRSSRGARCFAGAAGAGAGEGAGADARATLTGAESAAAVFRSGREGRESGRAVSAALTTAVD